MDLIPENEIVYGPATVWNVRVVVRTCNNRFVGIPNTGFPTDQLIGTRNRTAVPGQDVIEYLSTKANGIIVEHSQDRHSGRSCGHAKIGEIEMFEVRLGEKEFSQVSE